MPQPVNACSTPPSPALFAFSPPSPWQSPVTSQAHNFHWLPWTDINKPPGHGGKGFLVPRQGTVVAPSVGGCPWVQG